MVFTYTHCHCVALAAGLLDSINGNLLCAFNWCSAFLEYYLQKAD